MTDILKNEASLKGSSLIECFDRSFLPWVCWFAGFPNTQWEITRHVNKGEALVCPMWGIGDSYSSTLDDWLILAPSLVERPVTITDALRKPETEPVMLTSG